MSERWAQVRWTDDRIEHIAEHNVECAEAEEAILDPPRWVTPGREGTHLVYGRTDAGRYLFVVIVDEGRGVAFVVTAREMTGTEKKTYKRKAR